MDTLDKSVNYAHETLDKLASASSNAAESLGEKAEDLLYAERKMMKQCNRFIREHPNTAVGIAVVAGFLLSSLLKSR